MRGDQEVVATYRFACLLKLAAYQCIYSIGGCFEGQNVKRAEYRFDLSREAR